MIEAIVFRTATVSLLAVVVGSWGCGGDDGPMSDPNAVGTVTLSIVDQVPGAFSVAVDGSAVGILDPIVDVVLTDTAPGVAQRADDVVTSGANTAGLALQTPPDVDSSAYQFNGVTDLSSDQTLSFSCLQVGMVSLSVQVTWTSAIDAVSVSASATVSATCDGQFTEWPAGPLIVLFLCPEGTDAVLQAEACDGPHIISIVKGTAGLHTMFGWDMDLSSTSHGTMLDANGLACTAQCDEIQDVPESVDVTITKVDSTAVVMQLSDAGILIKSVTQP
jgi:hypothetical protein